MKPWLITIHLERVFRKSEHVYKAVPTIFLAQLVDIIDMSNGFCIEWDPCIVWCHETQNLYYYLVGLYGRFNHFSR